MTDTNQVLAESSVPAEQAQEVVKDVLEKEISRDDFVKQSSGD
jgi:hypothetical protein